MNKIVSLRFKDTAITKHVKKKEDKLFIVNKGALKCFDKKKFINKIFFEKAYTGYLPNDIKEAILEFFVDDFSGLLNIFLEEWCNEVNKLTGTGNSQYSLVKAEFHIKKQDEKPSLSFLLSVIALKNNTTYTQFLRQLKTLSPNISYVSYGSAPDNNYESALFFGHNNGLAHNINDKNYTSIMFCMEMCIHVNKAVCDNTFPSDLNVKYLNMFKKTKDVFDALGFPELFANLMFYKPLYYQNKLPESYTPDMKLYYCDIEKCNKITQELLEDINKDIKEQYGFICSDLDIDYVDRNSNLADIDDKDISNGEYYIKLNFQSIDNNGKFIIGSRYNYDRLCSYGSQEQGTDLKNYVSMDAQEFLEMIIYYRKIEYAHIRNDIIINNFVLKPRTESIVLEDNKTKCCVIQ
ncbi:MAG: hypothetical protein GY730_05735 [bacterium]|nr:hypothetical protein [bacterium]